MALSKSTANNPRSWECGFETNVGAIWFATLVIKDPHYPDYETRYLEKFETALSTIPWAADENEEHYRQLNQLITKKCYVLRGRTICIGRKRYQLLKCIVYCNALLFLSKTEKMTYLELVAHRLFSTYNRLLRDNYRMLRKVPQLCFRENGFPLSNSHALQMAVKSLCFALSEHAPVTAKNGGLKPLEYGSNGLVRSFELEPPQEGIAITQPMIVRGVVDRFIPCKALNEIVKEGLCFAPGCKNGTTENGKEKWTVHVHVPNPDDLDGCRQPPSLQSAAKLAVLEACMRAKREKHSPRYSPYFSALYQ